TGSCGRATTRTSAPTGRTRGARSRRRSRAFTPPSASRSSPGMRCGSTASAPEPLPASLSTYVISLTPFAADESLDEVALRAHLRRLADAGIGVFSGGGGAGEAYTLDPYEARRVLEIGVEELRGRVPVRAMGVEPRSAREMIAYATVAADVGVDALQVYSLDVGHGNRPRSDELRRYLSDVLDAVTLPVVLSSHFSVGYALPPDLVAELAQQHDGIIGVNCSHDDLT